MTLSDQDVINEYGVLADEYRPKDIITMRNDGLQALVESRAFGTDIATTTEETLVNFSENSLTEPARIDAQVNLAVLQKDMTTASGAQLATFSDGLGLDGRKPDSPASGYIRFDRTGKVGTTVATGIKVNNGLTGDSKVTYITQEEVEMPAVFEFTKRISDNVYFSSAGNYPNFLRFKEIICVSDTADRAAAETADYTETTDYTYTAYDDFIHFTGVTEPAIHAKFYIKFNDVSANILCTSDTAGTKGNVNQNTITVLETPVTYITSVTNDDDITNGYNEETDEDLRRRMKSAPRQQKNLEYLLSQILDVQSIRAVAGYEDATNLGAVRVTVDSTVFPMPQLIYDNVIDRIQAVKTVGSQATAVVRLLRGTAANGTDYFPAPFQDTWMVGRVNTAVDFSGTSYTRGTDFLYTEYSGYIDWAPTGAEPTASTYYFVELIRAIKPATNVIFDIAVSATLELNQDKDTVEQELSNSISAYMNGRFFGEDVFFYEITRIINENTSIGVILDVKFTAKFKMTRHATADEDLLPLEGLAQLLTVSVNEDLSSPKVYLTNYSMDSNVVNITRSAGPTACVISISNKKLRTYEDGVLTINEDLESLTLTELETIVDAVSGYTMNVNTDGSVPAKYLEDVESVSILSTVVNLRGNNMIYWITGAPTASTEFWIDADFRGSFFLRDEEIARLGTLTLTEV
jgi:uncharacterized phage protein gp47/JayE